MFWKPSAANYDIDIGADALIRDIVAQVGSVEGWHLVIDRWARLSQARRSAEQPASWTKVPKSKKRPKPNPKG